MISLGWVVTMFVATQEVAPPGPVGPVGPVVALPAPMNMAPPVDDAAVAGEWSRLRARRRLARRLTAGGFAGFGAAFFANMIGGGVSGTLGEDPTTIAGLVPVAGPFVMAAWQGSNAGWKTFFVIDGLAQAGLLAMGITGAVMNKRAGRALAQPRFAGLDGRLERRLDEPDLRRRGRLGLGLGLGGFIGFGVVYLGTTMSMFAAESERLLTSDTDVQRIWAAAPVVGPFVVAGQADLAGTRAMMAVFGVLQIGTLATGITGAVIRGRRMRDAESRVLQDVGVSPWIGGATTGLMIRARF